eukprot:m.1032035 g.1032035  ORF g.1032035 m.1032035 type:complete len:96 (+) comp24123_c1_seq17:3748-4035(+)
MRSSSPSAQRQPVRHALQTHPQCLTSTSTGVVAAVLTKGGVAEDESRTAGGGGAVAVMGPGTCAVRERTKYVFPAGWVPPTASLLSYVAVCDARL